MTLAEGHGTHVSIDLSNPDALHLMKEDKAHFGNFYFENVNDIAKIVLEYHKKREGKDNQRIIEGRTKLADFATAYLEKMGYMLPEAVKEKVLAKINTLKNSDPNKTIILMTAHQPNLFAYSGILRKIALIRSVENQIKKIAPDMNVICFYGFGDHDFVHNKWVRSAEMPAPLKRDGILRFSIDVGRKDLFLPSNKIPKPTADKLKSWRAQIDGWISENSALAAKFAKSNNLESAPKNISDAAKKSLEDYWKYVEQGNEKATSLAEFSSFTFAAIVNTVLDTPVVFANFSDCYTAFGKEYKWLLSNISEYSDAIQKNEATLKGLKIESGLSEDVSDLLPLWIKCSCGSKYRISSISQGKYSGKCVRCENEVVYSQEQLNALLESSPQLFEPRSISMPLAFARAIDVSCYVGGVGGIGYLMHGKAIAERLNSPFPITPFWQVEDKYIGIEILACAWEAKRISTSYGLSQTEYKPFEVLKSTQIASDELNNKMAQGLVPKTGISERERQLLEQIPKSLKVNSCAIGYAINIGIGPAYTQWINFLDNGGNLLSPVSLKSILA